MLSDDDLAKIAALVTAIVREELERLRVKARPPSDVSEKRRAAAMKRWENAKCNANASPMKASKGKASMQIAMQVHDASADDRRAAWEAYSAAYSGRYGVEPVRNAKVNAQMKQFCTRIANGEAAQVAAFYLSHSKGIYVSARHCVDLLLRDAEGLRMEWATGRRGSQSEAKLADATQGRGNVWGKLIEEASRNGQ